MTAEHEDPPRRQAERLIDDDRRMVPTHGQHGEPFYPPNPGAVQWLDEDDREKVESLIRMEPTLAKIAKRHEAVETLGTLVVTLAKWLTAMGAGLVVLKEIMKWGAK